MKAKFYIFWYSVLLWEKRFITKKIAKTSARLNKLAVKHTAATERLIAFEKTVIELTVKPE